jgi:hypothetical protein
VHTPRADYWSGRLQVADVALDGLPHDSARSLAGPFDGMFSFHNAHVAIAVNWGIAAVVYSFVGGLIARMLGGSHR